MTQRSIAIQTSPPETSVTAALRRFADSHGWCVTHTTDGQHSANSLHYVGRAVDLAAVAGPGVDTPALLAINLGVLQFMPIAQISELIYAGPGGRCVKNGKFVDGYAVYGAEVMSEHHNHVHLGVVANYSLTAPEAPMPDAAPDYEVNAAPLSLSITPSGNGYIILCSDGGVFCFGDAKYLGRVHKKT